MPPKKNPASNTRPALYKIGECRDCEALNANLRLRIESLSPNDIIHRNHLLSGRYENLYVAIESIPDMRVVLDLATAHAAHILGRPKKALRLGWWLNVMQPGETTCAHTHYDDDELLAGVYYIDVPAPSGELVLKRETGDVAIQPRAGLFVFFSPALCHEVTANLSGQPRLSVGFNVRPAPA